jgi:hypothetical protein
LPPSLSASALSEVPGEAWIAQGPSPTLGGQTENVVPGNEVAGAIQTVAAHPTDPNTVYVGAINGGIWRTRNATDVRPHWTPLTDHLPSLSIGALEFDPANADRLLAGTGRFSSLAFFGDVLNGLLLTSDGGDSWTEITHPLLLGENISGVAVRGDLLLAASNGTFGLGGLFRSTDGGSSWTQVSGSNGLPNQDVFDLVGDPTYPFRFYVSVRATGIFRSDDGGATWVNVSLASPALTGVITLTGNNNTEMSTAGDGRLYVAVLVNGRPAYIGFTDYLGASWMAMDLPQTLESNGEVEGLNPGGQGYIHFSIRADPVLSHIVYIAGDREDSPFPNFIGARNFSGRLFRGNTTVPSTGTVPSPQWEHLTHLNTVAAIRATASTAVHLTQTRERWSSMQRGTSWRWTTGESMCARIPGTTLGTGSRSTAICRQPSSTILPTTRSPGSSSAERRIPARPSKSRLALRPGAVSAPATEAVWRWTPEARRACRSGTRAVKTSEGSAGA